MFVKPTRPVLKIFLHHSATDLDKHDNVEFLERVHVKENGWVAIGYHYFIDKSGTRHACRDINRIPAAQKGFNSKSIAICLSGRNLFTAAQFGELKTLCNEINDAYDGEVTFHGHKEVSATLCPAYDYKKILNLDENGYIMKPASIWILIKNFLERLIK